MEIICQLVAVQCSRWAVGNEPHVKSRQQLNSCGNIVVCQTLRDLELAVYKTTHYSSIYSKYSIRNHFGSRSYMRDRLSDQASTISELPTETKWFRVCRTGC